MPGSVRADEPENQATLLTTKRLKGLKFQVPEDWPIEKRDGVVGPIPIEEYLAQKFNKVHEQLAAIQTAIQLLSERVEKIELDEAETRSLRSSEDVKP